MPDVIQKRVELKAPIERVWEAISDHERFGSWFKVRLDGPFVAGEEQTGQITYPGYEHMPWKARVVAVEAPHRLAFDWPHMDGEQHVREDWPWTRVEFRLEARGDGTLLTITESGFDALPPETRDISYRQNEGGWEEQSRNIAAHVDG
jgi:uncharacterized protein YndB with AHSA1/START domain